MRPHEYWSEMPAERKVRILQQESDRDSLVNDCMELVYSMDLDEIFAELLRLHAVVKDERTQELIDRIFADANRFDRG